MQTTAAGVRDHEVEMESDTAEEEEVRYKCSHTFEWRTIHGGSNDDRLTSARAHKNRWL